MGEMWLSGVSYRDSMGSKCCLVRLDTWKSVLDTDEYIALGLIASWEHNMTCQSPNIRLHINKGANQLALGYLKTEH